MEIGFFRAAVKAFAHGIRASSAEPGHGDDDDQRSAVTIGWSKVPTANHRNVSSPEVIADHLGCPCQVQTLLPRRLGVVRNRDREIRDTARVQWQ